MISLKTTGYKPDDYKFIRIVFRNGMEKVFSCYCCNTDCDICKYKRACGDIIRLLDFCQKENR